MQLGNLMLIVTLLVTVGSAAAYIYTAIRKPDYVSIGRMAYFMSASAVVVISAYFMALILKNHFEIEYIAFNSSRDLPLSYKVSVFWAGQQGSFLFWALCSAVMGLFVMRKAREFEPWLMAVWSMMQGLFLLLLLIDSPFKLISQDMLLQMTGSTASLADGRGLRELLQNPWMVIHPPATFIGYAAMSIPAVFAIAALIMNDFKGWLRTTLPWAVFGWITLGAGILLGAYWAYEVLGWGGYWGWDPVENSSLIPWLTGTALLHTMIAERYRGSFRRVNIVLSLVTFLFVFYATFLTRSNVLGDSSVHTFGDTRVSTPLLMFMLAFLLLSTVLVVLRWRKLAGEPSYTTTTSKDFLFFLLVTVFTISAFLVLAGTSAPIIGKLWHTKISLKQAFYNTTNAPVALIILALMALAPVIVWRRRRSEDTPSGDEIRQALFFNVTVGLVILIIAAAAAALVLKKQPIYIIVLAAAMIAASLAALGTNACILIRLKRFGMSKLGGYIAHVGVAVMFFGVVLSANGGAAETVPLVKGQPKTVNMVEFGLPEHKQDYRLTFLGTELINERKASARIQVERKGYKVTSNLAMEVTRDNEILSRPSIIKRFPCDLYMAPQSIPTPREVVLTKGEPVEVEGFTLTLNRLNVPHGHGGDEVRISAELIAEIDGRKEILSPRLIMRRSKVKPGTAVKVPGSSDRISLDRISVEEKAVTVTFTPEGGSPEQLRLIKGEEISAGGRKLLFTDWYFEGGGHGEGGVGAVINISQGGKTVTVKPLYEPGEDARPQVSSMHEPVDVPGGDAQVELLMVDANSGQVSIAVTPHIAVVNISVKPYMSLLWIGSILALFGGSIAMWQRMVESSKDEASAVEEKEAKTEPVKV